LQGYVSTIKFDVIAGHPNGMKGMNNSRQSNILKLHKHHQGFGKKLHMSIFEASNSKYLAVNTSKFLSSYSIHFEISQ
jgi:hypothetical protein